VLDALFLNLDGLGTSRFKRYDAIWMFLFLLAKETTQRAEVIVEPGE
jgi:hypothetical protein